MRYKLALGAILAVAAASSHAAFSFSGGLGQFNGDASASYVFTTLPGELDGGAASSFFTTSGTTVVSGFNITSITLDGVELGTDVDTGVFNSTKTLKFHSDTYTFASTTISGGQHTLTVVGIAASPTNSGYNGAFAVSPVPEASGYGMALVGMGLVGSFIRRQSRKS